MLFYLVNTTLAAATGAATALFTGAIWNGHKGELAFELPLAMNGALGGLVAVTAGKSEIKECRKTNLGLD